MAQLSYIPVKEFEKLKSISDKFERVKIFANMARFNMLYMVEKASSGHMGTSMSSIDIMSWLWLEEMKNGNEGKDNSDIFFSSKGHDIPALYSILIASGRLPEDKLHVLRRINGLPGHPDIGTPFIVSNTGSLGMGISKARGMALAKRKNGKKGNVFVLTGDGELQEGQIWESLGQTAIKKYGEITVIVDHNKMQSDTLVKEVSDLGDLEAKFKAFGWQVYRVPGHDLPALAKVLSDGATVTDKPKIIIADTVKGKGVSFMEKLGDDGLYKFHAGAMPIELYLNAVKELKEKIDSDLTKNNLSSVEIVLSDAEPIVYPADAQKVVSAYGDELVKIARVRKDLIALDADLYTDCGLIAFRNEFPDRFIECGIAEQDMVSMGGGLALQGMLPIMHSFSCFLSTRPNEQIYNNATELTKVIYVGTLSGVIPGMPGHSHQSVRDISALASTPHLIMIEPSCEHESRLAIRYAVYENKESTYLRFASVPTKIPFSLPANYALEIGKGAILEEGIDGAIIAYGPTMLTEAFHARAKLIEQGKKLALINFPWLNRTDEKWFKENLFQYKYIFTIDDHYTRYGVGEHIGAALLKAGYNGVVRNFGVDDVPACGRNDDVLRFHSLSSDKLFENINNEIK